MADSPLDVLMRKTREELDDMLHKARYDGEQDGFRRGQTYSIQICQNNGFHAASDLLKADMEIPF